MAYGLHFGHRRKGNRLTAHRFPWTSWSVQRGRPSAVAWRSPVERSGPSIEFKIVLLVAAAVVVQDLVLLAMYLAGAEPVAIQAVLGGVLALALILAAVWGNTVARAVRRLARACFVARQGDTAVLAELTRTDELGQLNDEINRLVVLVRELTEERGALAEGADVADAITAAAPDLLRSSREILVSLKELKEGAAAELQITRRIAGRHGTIRSLLDAIVPPALTGEAETEVGTKLRSLPALAREIEFLADEVVDEVARADVDEGALARAVNGMRDAARTMAEVARETVLPLERRRADLAAAAGALEQLDGVERERSDGGRVAELMERSAGTGMGEGARLASALKRIGLKLESYDRRKRVSR